MQTGKLNRLVTIQQRGSAQDAAGQPVESWTTLAQVWANVRYPLGSETIRAGTPISTVQASIRIRRRTDVTAAMRVLLGTTVFQILAVLPDEQDRQRVDLVCEIVPA